MTDRDRAIELIRQSGCVSVWDYYNDDFVEPDPIQTLADYLLANGVIVPPVRVGSKVYKISRNKVKECEVVFVGISADERCSHFNFVENYEDGTFYKSYSMVFDVIGKTVFLTKEEAEAKLKEMNEDG